MKISYMKQRGDVRYECMADFKTVGMFYASELVGRGWEISPKNNLQRNFWVQTFSRGSETLDVRVDGRGKSKSEVRLTPAGMRWEEDDQPSPKDLPIPDDATDLQYTKLLEWIRFKSVSDFATVVAFMSEGFEKRQWKKGPVEVDVERFIRMTYTYDKSELELDIRDLEPGVEVWIRAKGLQWDGMESEIERARRIATEVPPQQQTAEMEVAVQRQKAKSPQDVDRRQELANEATVVLDGETIKMSHVTAYTVFEHNEWFTKVIASQKPIKQDTLLARLKKTGTDLDEEDSPPNWREPYLQVILDESNRPLRMNFLANGTPGGGSSSELNGSVLVEGGHVRGTVALKEPGYFFEKIYTSQISFDVAVLTKDSIPEKRLAAAPQLPNFGKLTIGNSTYHLKNVVAYEMNLFNEPMTTVLLTEKPINLHKLKSAIGREAIDNYFEFTPQIKFVLDADDNVSFVHVWADNISLNMNSNGGMDDDVVIEDGRARGTLQMTAPGEFNGEEYTFNVSFDVEVLGKRNSPSGKPTAGLAADSYEGLPIPKGYEEMQSEGSSFRKRSSAIVVGDLNEVLKFYRTEMASGAWGEWKEMMSDTQAGGTIAELVFSGATGDVIVELQARGRKTGVTLVSRDAVAAKAAGVLPTPGKGRLLIISELAQEAVIIIGRREHKVAAGAGAEGPSTAKNLEVVPGGHVIGIKTRGGQRRWEFRIGANETKAAIIDASGDLTFVTLY